MQVGYDRTRLVEHVKQSMVNVQSLRQTGQSFDSRHSFSSNLFCRFEDNSSSMSSALCISDQYDEHLNSSHLQRHQSSTIIGTSNGEFIRKILDVKHQQNEHFPSKVHRDWLMIFLASKPNLFCRRSKFFDPGRYPSLEQWIIVIYSHCMNFSDFYFEDSQANQLVCDFLDTLALKSKVEEEHELKNSFLSHFSRCFTRRKSSLDVRPISFGTRTSYSSCCFTSDHRISNRNIDYLSPNVSFFQSK